MFLYDSDIHFISILLTKVKTSLYDLNEYKKTKCVNEKKNMNEKKDHLVSIFVWYHVLP